MSNCLPQFHRSPSLIPKASSSSSASACDASKAYSASAVMQVQPTQQSPWEARSHSGVPLALLMAHRRLHPLTELVSTVYHGVPQCATVNHGVQYTVYTLWLSGQLHSFFGTSVCNSVTPSRHCLHMLLFFIFGFFKLILSISHTSLVWVMVWFKVWSDEVWEESYEERYE